MLRPVHLLVLFTLIHPRTNMRRLHTYCLFSYWIVLYVLHPSIADTSHFPSPSLIFQRWLSLCTCTLYKDLYLYILSSDRIYSFLVIIPVTELPVLLSYFFPWSLYSRGWFCFFTLHLHCCVAEFYLRPNPILSVAQLATQYSISLPISTFCAIFEYIEFWHNTLARYRSHTTSRRTFEEIRRRIEQPLRQSAASYRKPTRFLTEEEILHIPYGIRFIAIRRRIL